jgi:hypothetical protein
MADRNDATPPPGPFIRSYAAEGRFQHTDAERASVLFYPSGGYSVATVRGITHHGKRIYDRRPTSICEIALGTFESSLELSLPALGGTTFFRAEVDIQWQAVDPHQAAVSVVRDVVRQLRAPVLERLRRIARDYRVSDAQNADSAIAAECQSGRWGDLGNDIGLQTRVFVRLTVDDKTIAEVERLRDVRAEHHVSMTAEEQQAELIALRKMGLREVLAGDHLDALVHMLAVRPEQLPEFMEKLRQENRSDQQRFTSHVLEMIESGRIHSVDLEQQVRRMLGAHSPYPLNDALGPAPVHRVEQ